MQRSADGKRSWVEAEDQVWSDLRKQERRRRDLFWMLVGIALLVIGSMTRFPARLFMHGEP